MAGADDRQIRSLLIRGKNVFASTRDLKFYRALEGRREWEHVADAPGGHFAGAHPPLDDQPLIVNNSRGLFSSEDDGDHWRPLGTRQFRSGYATVMMAKDGSLFAIGDDGIYRSTDMGEAWALCVPNPEGPYALSALTRDPQRDDRVAAHVHDGRRGSILHCNSEDQWRIVSRAVFMRPHGLGFLEPHGSCGNVRDQRATLDNYFPKMFQGRLHRSGLAIGADQHRTDFAFEAGEPKRIGVRVVNVSEDDGEFLEATGSHDLWWIKWVREDGERLDTSDAHAERSAEGLVVITLAAGERYERTIDLDELHAWEPGHYRTRLVYSAGRGDDIGAARARLFMGPVWTLVIT